MKNKEDVVDRRRHKRFRVPTSAFTFFGSHSAKLGQILDIGMGGLSFSYVPGDERPYNSQQLDILLPGGAFYLDRIPFETVSDYKMGSMGHPSRARRCGVEFGPLSDRQKSELNYFIEYYASDDEARRQA